MSVHTIMIDEWVRSIMIERARRLEREAAALLAAGYEVGELTIVVSLEHPDGVVMACEHVDAYAAELRRAGR